MRSRSRRSPGCGLHKKQKPAAIALTPPPDLKQTPLYTPEMGDKAPVLPPLPGVAVGQGAARTARPTGTPQEAARHTKPSPAKPLPDSETASAPKDAPAPPVSSGETASSGLPPGTVAKASVIEPGAITSPIGQLSDGTKQDSGQSKHDTAELIRTTQNGISAVKRTLSPDESKIVMQIHSFLQQAQKALDNGDTDGAFTLATKARVLLDELSPASP